ncbi:MAG TPA: S-methyl-5-thioribose-1-phosphate isomerase [Ilumatobacteraceae bacterium]
MGTARRRTIWWDDDHLDAGPGAGAGAVLVIDQRRLPHVYETARWVSVADAVDGIADMQVRGAPLIGVAAAHGIALAMADDDSDTSLVDAGERLCATRPTAVNLRWAVERMTTALRPMPRAERAQAARAMASTLADEDAAACRAIGEGAASALAAIQERTGRAVQILTHCNAGWLACVEWGTATAPVYIAHERGVPVHVWVSETRPRNQGASLTAWELGQAGVPHTLVVDNAAAHLMTTGAVDCVIVGADRVAANGDVANKIGTCLKAYAAEVHGVPFHVAIPWSTVDWSCPDGGSIPIEERSADEVAELGGQRIAPAGTPIRNWGFDVTPARYVTSFFTPNGPITPDGLDAWRRSGSA